MEEQEQQVQQKQEEQEDQKNDNIVHPEQLQKKEPTFNRS
jgi:hypothetical protein